METDDVPRAPKPEHMESTQDGTRTFMQNNPEYKYTTFKELLTMPEKDMQFLDVYDYKIVNDLSKAHPGHYTNCFACAVGGLRRKEFSRSGIPATKPHIPQKYNDFKHLIYYLEKYVSRENVAQIAFRICKRDGRTAVKSSEPSGKRRDYGEHVASISYLRVQAGQHWRCPARLDNGLSESVQKVLHGQRLVSTTNSK